MIEVNPRHVPFYRRALKFEPIGRSGRTSGEAPRLLCASFEAIAEGLKKFGGQHELAPERSLFPWGFSPKEEAGILDRLTTLEAKRPESAGMRARGFRVSSASELLRHQSRFR